MDYAKVGAQVAQRMRELHLSNTDLARRAGVDRSRITMILKGEPWSMRPHVVAKIEGALELKTGALGALGAGRSLRSVVMDVPASDLETRIAALESAVGEQRDLLEQLVGHARDDARLGPGRGARR